MKAAAPPDEILLSVENVSLSFGGVTAITDVSFNIVKGEIRAIIGPNGAGKTSMLNVINGFYHPQIGRIAFRGRARSRMRPFEAAEQGIARTFQNVALFKGMTTLDNIMTGRTLRMTRGFFWQLLRHGPALEEEIAATALLLLTHNAHIWELIVLQALAGRCRRPWLRYESAGSDQGG